MEEKMRTKIINSRIFQGNGEILEEADILFDETGILGIGASLCGEADRVLDGRGRTVLPGFIDCHTHLAGLGAEDELTVAFRTQEGARELLRSGITTTRAVGTKYGADIRLRDLIGRGEVKGPRILASGEVLCITCGHCAEIGIECDTVGEVLKAARSQCKRGVDWIKFMATSGVLGVGPSTEVQLSREQIEAIIRVGRAFDRPTCAHIMNYEALKTCVEAGITCVEHGYDLDEAMARRMVEMGTWYVPTVAVTLMESTYIKPDTPKNRELVKKAAAAQKKVRNAVRIAIKEGVKLAVGTDTGCPFTNPAMYAYATELKLYHMSGMDNQEVLTCATRHGAELLGIEKETGTLEAGKAADVVLVEGDPLEDIEAVKDVRATFCKGELLYYKA